MYLHEHDNWTSFSWDEKVLSPHLETVRLLQGKLLGMTAASGFEVRADAEVRAVTDEVVASSEIEGIRLDPMKVRSSVSRQLGLDAGTPIDTHDVDGAVSVMMDATQNASQPITKERLLEWHAALFPTGRSGLRKIRAGAFRADAMQVVSGAIGREKVHFEAVDPGRVELAMEELIAWLNSVPTYDPLVKAGIAHLWFLTIHPFDDGNGRIARALTELLLARSDGSQQRYYSMAKHILDHRASYYEALERSQHGTPDVTGWLCWFLCALEESIAQSMTTIEAVRERELFWQSLAGVPLNERQRMMLQKLKGGFEGKLTAAKWAKICKVSPDTALRDINDLVGKGVLTRSAAGGRSTSYELNDEQASPT